MAYNINQGFKLKLIDLSDDTQVNSGGGTNTQTLQPPNGKIYQVIDIYMHIPDPVGSSANAHTMDVSFQNCYLNENLAYISANTGTAMYISNSGFVGTSEQPSNAREQYLFAHHSLFCSYDQPINFLYTNNTDANQTGTRRLEIFVKEYNEMS